VKTSILVAVLVPFLMMSSVMAGGKVVLDRGRDAGIQAAAGQRDGGTPDIPDASLDVKITRRLDLAERLAAMKKDIEKTKPVKAFDIYWVVEDSASDLAFLVVDDGTNKVGLMFVYRGKEKEWELLENTFRAP